MENLAGLLVLVVLAILATPVLVIVLFSRVASLRDRMAALEGELAELRAAPLRAVPQPPPMRVPASIPPTPPAPAPMPAPLPTLAPAPSQPRPPARPSPPVRPALATIAARLVRHWFTEGNVPVKVGVLVLFAGVAALLKYATDQGWMRVPVELKLAAVALAALAALVFGWMQRERRRSFALALQGGAIGVLLLVVFAAFRLLSPPLIPAGMAFAASVALVAACGVLAVRQNAPALAVLATLAGFLAPIWLSTGSGNHVVLFTYYAVLDIGIVAIAWFRAWRMLNLLGFFFTFAIGIAWGALRYQPEQFNSTEPFLLLFFALFTAVPILFARLRAAGRRDFVDGCLLFGTPLVAFSLQAGLLEGEQMPLAGCALALAALYATLAWLLRKRPHYQPLVAPYAVLAFGFATLAVPLALSAQATAAVFALEGACAVWLGLRQGQRLPQLAGAALQLLAAVGFADGLPYYADQPVLHAGFMLAALVSIAGLASAWCYRRATPEARGLALPYYLWGLGWWLLMGGREIDAFVVASEGPRAWLLFVSLTGLLAAEVFRWERARALAVTTVLALVAGLLLAPAFDGQPLEGWNLAAWLCYAAMGWRSVMCLRESAPGLRFAHVAWWGSLALAASIEMHEVAGALGLGAGWRWAGAGLPWWLLAAGTWLRPSWVRLPAGPRFDEWRPWQGDLLLVVIGSIGVLGLMSAGSAAPWPWLPLLNPLELLQFATLGLFAWRLYRGDAGRRPSAANVSVLAALAFVLSTVMVLRCTHHWGGVPWGPGMFDVGLVQTALTVAWSVLGVAGWIVGSRRGVRGIWLGGALLMGVVLAKLVFVDRDHLGNLLGIGSFLAYGLLCTAVGYFAPVPPPRRS